MAKLIESGYARGNNALLLCDDDEEPLVFGVDYKGCDPDAEDEAEDALAKDIQAAYAEILPESWRLQPVDVAGEVMYQVEVDVV